MISAEYRIDVVPGMTDMEVIHVSQYDTDFQILLYVVASVGNFSIESGTTIELRGTKPDGTTYTKQVYTSGANHVLLQGDADLTDVAGKGVFELCFTHNNKWLHTDNFIVKIEVSPAERN